MLRGFGNSVWWKCSRQRCSKWFLITTSQIIFGAAGHWENFPLVSTEFSSKGKFWELWSCIPLYGASLRKLGQTCLRDYVESIVRYSSGPVALQVRCHMGVDANSVPVPLLLWQRVFLTQLHWQTLRRGEKPPETMTEVTHRHVSWTWDWDTDR